LSRTLADAGDPLGPTFLAASDARGAYRAEALKVLRPIEQNAARPGRDGYLLAIV
jgi:hypothetical protein